MMSPAELALGHFLETDDVHIPRIAELWELGPEDVVFDIGSGEGRFLRLLHKQTGCVGVGVEVLEAKHRLALEHNKGLIEDQKLFFISGFAEDLKVDGCNVTFEDPPGTFLTKMVTKVYLYQARLTGNAAAVNLVQTLLDGGATVITHTFLLSPDVLAYRDKSCPDTSTTEGLVASMLSGSNASMFHRYRGLNAEERAQMERAEMLENKCRELKIELDDVQKKISGKATSQRAQAAQKQVLQQHLIEARRSSDLARKKLEDLRSKPPEDPKPTTSPKHRRQVLESQLLGDESKKRMAMQEQLAAFEADVRGAAQDDLYTCLSCNWDNPSNRRTCEYCGESRGDGIVAWANSGEDWEDPVLKQLPKRLLERERAALKERERWRDEDNAMMSKLEKERHKGVLERRKLMREADIRFAEIDMKARDREMRTIENELNAQMLREEAEVVAKRRADTLRSKLGNAKAELSTARHTLNAIIDPHTRDADCLQRYM